MLVHSFTDKKRSIVLFLWLNTADVESIWERNEEITQLSTQFYESPTDTKALKLLKKLYKIRNTIFSPAMQ